MSGQQTPARLEITDLTACRALFAAWVFAYHVDLHAQFSPHLGVFKSFIQHGYMGVDGFFLLSGMILTRVHPELKLSTKTYRRFWLKRLARIYPVHLAVIVMLGVFVAVGVAMGASARDPARFGLIGLVQNLLLIQGWGFGNPWTWNYPAWTVSTEMAGYLLFPWIARYASWIGTLVFGQIALLCVPILGMLEVESGHALNIASTFPLLRFFPELVIGIQLANMLKAAEYMPRKTLLVAGGFLILIGGYTGGDIIVVMGLAAIMFAFMVQAAIGESPYLRRLPFLQPLGRLSYAFYMSFATSELLLAQVFRREHFDPAGHKLIYAAAMTAITFGIALILHFLVENPCRRFADRRLTPKTQTAPSMGNNPVPGSNLSSPAR